MCALTITLGLTTHLSQAQQDLPPDFTRLESPAHIATPAGRVRVTIIRTKPRLHLAKQQRPVVNSVLDDDNTDYYDELPDLQVGYRRPELIDQTATVDGDISYEIKIRLALARMRALEAYTKKWA